ncbi:hypothetical protein VDGL01_09121 [Verticillium dahliae]
MGSRPLLSGKEGSRVAPAFLQAELTSPSRRRTAPPMPHSDWEGDASEELCKSSAQPPSPRSSWQAKLAGLVAPQASDQTRLFRVSSVPSILSIVFLSAYTLPRHV